MVKHLVESKRGAHRRRAEPGHRAVKPAGEAEPPDIAAQQQHQGRVRDGIERDVEDVGERGRRGRRPAERLDREDEITHGPAHQADPEQDGDGTAAPEVGGLEDAQRAGDDLERDYAPAVEPGGVVAERVDHDVADHERSEDHVHGADDRMRPVDLAPMRVEGSTNRGACAVAGAHPRFSRSIVMRVF